MNKKEDIIGIIDNIQLQDLLRMEDDEKNDLILRLKHAIKHEKNSKKGCEKTKHIVKPRKQVDYKKYVRESMKRIMTKLSKRLFRLTKEKGNIRGEIQFKQRFQESLKRKKDNFRKNIKKIIGETNADDLCCSICLQLMISPVMIACGHAFCYQCLDESLIFSKVCPNCRDSIKIPQIIKAGLLDKIIKAKAIVQPNTGEIQYSVRLSRHQQWKRQREVDLKSLKAGFLLDVRDTQNIWCQGTVLDVFYQQPKSEIPHALLIHFNKWNKIYNEIIQLPSLRVAPVQFFSSRRDIPFYRLAQQDDNLRGLVVPNRIDNMFQANLLDSESQDNLMDDESSSLSQIQQAQEDDENIAPIQQLFNMNIALRVPHFQNVEMQMQRLQMINMLGDIIGRAEAQPLFRYNGEEIEDATRRIDEIMEFDEQQFSFQDDLEGYEEQADQQ